MNARRPRALLLLAVIVGLETLLMASATGFLVWELIVDVPLSYASAVALVVLAALTTIVLAVIVVNLLRGGQPWVRAGVVVWQILQIAVAVGLFQGAEARPDLGWMLLAPSILAIILLFTKSVLAATARRV